MNRTFLRAMELAMVTGDDGLDLAATGGSMTFFAPTDEAFAQLGSQNVEKLLKNGALLKTVRFYKPVLNQVNRTIVDCIE